MCCPTCRAPKPPPSAWKMGILGAMQPRERSSRATQPAGCSGLWEPLSSKMATPGLPYQPNLSSMMMGRCFVIRHPRPGSGVLFVLLFWQVIGSPSHPTCQVYNHTKRSEWQVLLQLASWMLLPRVFVDPRKIPSLSSAIQMDATKWRVGTCISR